jgi:replicative DNA helicase
VNNGHQRNQRRANDRAIAELPRMFDKQPPVDIEAEAAVLGSMLHDWRVCGDVMQIIKSADDFSAGKHAVIYQALVDLYDRHQAIDFVLLNSLLTERKLVDQIGGNEYLLELMESVPSAATAEHYARLVRQSAKRRGLIDAAGRMLYDAYNEQDIDEQIERGEASLFALADQQRGPGAVPVASLLQETFDRLEHDDGRMITGIETGFFELDEMTSGMQPGDMVIIAARPSMGKTAIALNIAEHIGATGKNPVAVFSLEMSRQQLAQRLLCARSGVDSHKLRRNMLSRDDFSRLSLAVGELTEAPLFIDDPAGLSIMQLRAMARRMASKHDIKVVIVDYLQLMSAPGHENRQQEVSTISRGIKALARELNVPVIALSQLNRASENRTRPRMSDLRESGSLEQDADVVMLLHREDYYHQSEHDYIPTNIGELIIAKQRNGPTGVVELVWDAATTTYRNKATQ